MLSTLENLMTSVRPGLTPTWISRARIAVYELLLSTEQVSCRSESADVPHRIPGPCSTPDADGCSAFSMASESLASASPAFRESDDMENWKDVRGFEGQYLVSDHGRVMSVYRQWRTKNDQLQMQRTLLMKCSADPNGYRLVKLV